MPIISRRAVMIAESRATLVRYFGRWSEQYQRFTTNLSTSRFSVRVLGADEASLPGIECVVHWVDRDAMFSTGEQSVCRSDGWSIELWQRLMAILQQGGDRAIALGLQALATSPTPGEGAIVAMWRAAIAGESGYWPDDYLPSALLPVPRPLVLGDVVTACVVSCSPNARVFPSLSDAIGRQTTEGRRLDRENQARYYLECTLSRLHGVRFGPDDYIIDEQFEATPEVQRLTPAYTARERSLIADPSLGNLMSRDRSVPASSPPCR